MVIFSGTLRRKTCTILSFLQHNMDSLFFFFTMFLFAYSIVQCVGEKMSNLEDFSLARSIFSKFMLKFHFRQNVIAMLELVFCLECISSWMTEENGTCSIYSMPSSQNIVLSIKLGLYIKKKHQKEKFSFCSLCSISAVFREDSNEAHGKWVVCNICT